MFARLTLSDVDQAGSWSTLIAPGREHGELDEVPVATVAAFLTAIRERRAPTVTGDAGRRALALAGRVHEAMTTA